MKEPLIIFGAGGHARVVATVASYHPSWTVKGVLDRSADSRGEKIGSTTVIGTFLDAAALFAKGVRHAALAFGDNDERAHFLAKLSKAGFEFPVLLHPTSIVERNVSLGRGTLVCAGAILCTGVRVGEAAIINTGAIVDHESEIGDCVHIAPGCRLAGRVKVGKKVFIGIGTVVRESITIGADTIVGAGSVVVSDLPAASVAMGSPARVRDKRR